MRSACRLGPVPAVPEIRLYLANDVLGLWQRTEDERGAGQPPPFWAFAWPGGQVLARYVLDHPDLVAGRRVLDLGSGSGLVAIAAALAGASRRCWPARSIRWRPRRSGSTRGRTGCRPPA